MTPMASPSAKASSWSWVTNRRGRAGLLEDRSQLLGQALAQVDVEAGEGLVEQQQARRRRQRARQRDALLLPPGQLVRRAPPGVGQSDQRQQLGDAPLALGARAVGDAEGDVLRHAQVREQGVVLEHHADAARLGRPVQGSGGVAQHLVAERDAAVGQRLQAGDRAQQRGLAAARGPDQHADLALERPKDTCDGRSARAGCGPGSGS
jgi:hypothetical protein